MVLVVRMVVVVLVRVVLAGGQHVDVYIDVEVYIFRCLLVGEMLVVA